jgi:hypothetical protein
VGRSIPIATKSELRQLGQCEAEEQAYERAENADDERLDDHGLEDLPPRRADRPQRRELARALGDRDAERVRDHEGADEESDAREREQEALDERREAADRLLVFFHLRGGIARLCRRRQH